VNLAPSACTLPRIRFGFVGYAFERSVVGLVIGLGLLRLRLIRLLLVFVTAAAHAHALRVSNDRRQAGGECKKHNNCRYAAFHVRTRKPRPQDQVPLGQSIDQIVGWLGQAWRAAIEPAPSALVTRCLFGTASK
jgi:hypothetical protein